MGDVELQEELDRLRRFAIDHALPIAGRPEWGGDLEFLNYRPWPIVPLMSPSEDQR